ncbi:MAG TPA: hypothetical protein VH088_11710 [Terriglobales bacterium]|jgi:hypothetical protein|nr:hypothetical protein [Terriglobales bacterium]
MPSSDDLKGVISSLERTLDYWSFWLTVFTLLVVVGLVIEYEHDVRELIKNFKWKLLQTVIGGILVTVGVAGELIVQYEASKVETDLRTASHQVEAVLEADAAQARKEAKQAENDAETARVKANSLEQANLRLRAFVKPRDLTKQESDNLLATCKRFPGHSVKIKSYMLDMDGMILAMEIERVLSRCPRLNVFDARWEYLPGKDLVRAGLAISGPPSEHEFVAALKKALSVDGELFISKLSPPDTHVTSDGDAVVILVGMKPLPRMK